MMKATLPGDNDADDDDEPSGVMVGIFLDAATAGALAVADGEAADSLHLTLCYIGEKDALDAVTVSQAMVSLRQFAIMQPPLRGTVSGYGRFTNSADDGAMDVFYASADVPGLSDLREALVDALTAQGVPVSTEHGFTPHITLAYLSPDAPNPTAPPNLPVRVTTLTLAVGGEQTTFPLIGTDVPGGLAYMSEDQGTKATEPQEYAGARHNKVDMAKIQQSHDHMVSLGANCFPPSPEQISNMTNREMSEEHGAFMVMSEESEHPDHHTIAFDIPQWFSEASEPPEWMPYLPRPLDFTHATYGKVSLTKERNANFVKVFNSGIYQKPIPIDGEHETKLSGAMAWVYALRQNDDHSVDAQVKWTPRGERMYREGSFKFISPQFYDRWKDPATGDVFTDVAIGGALTTRPFFKASHLRPLAASEDESTSPSSGDERSHGMTATTEAIAEKVVSAQEFTELREKHTTLETQFGEVIAERDTLKAANEAQDARIAKLEADARTKRFSELVSGWVGTPEKNRTRLEKVAERFGEDSEEFKDEVTQGRAFAEQVKMAEKVGGSIFKELGSNQAADDNAPAGRLDAMAKERQKESGGTKTYQQAYSEVLEENPDLYEG